MSSSEADGGAIIGKVFHDTYRIKRKVAEGGMGAIYEAEHARLSNKRYAVKLLHPSVTSAPDIFARFRREAEIASSLGHPNIVEVLDFYQTEQGQPYMVMEYLEGEDLAGRLRTVKRLEPALVLGLVDQVASALQAAHDKGIVHRDMKPENIFLARDPAAGEVAKVLDFGISKIRHSQSVVTRDNSLLGTPFYMSPEQGEGEVRDIDHTTDIFALGTICYQALSGELPFTAPTLPGVIYKVCHLEPVPVSDRVPDLPAPVDQVLARAMAKKKEQRYQRVSRLAEDLRAALAEDAAVASSTLQTKPFVFADTVAPTSSAADAVHDAGAMDEGSATLANTTLSRSMGERPQQAAPRPGSGRRTVKIAACVGGVAFLAAGAVLLLTREPTRPPPVAVAPPAPLTSAGPAARPRPVPPPKTQAPARPAPAPAVAPVPAAPQVKKVQITLRIKPRTARVLLDGEEVTDNPLLLKQSDKRHVLRFEAKGRTPVTRKVPADRSRTLRITLTRKRPRRGRGARAGKPKPIFGTEL